MRAEVGSKAVKRLLGFRSESMKVCGGLSEVTWWSTRLHRGCRRSDDCYKDPAKLYKVSSDSSEFTQGLTWTVPRSSKVRHGLRNVGESRRWWMSPNGDYSDGCCLREKGFLSGFRYEVEGGGRGGERESYDQTGLRLRFELTLL